MPDADYLIRAGIAFTVPVHPGALPVHPAAATGAQITEANRQYDGNLAMHERYMAVQGALRKQILTAVNNLYLAALEDEDLGYIATPQAMLAHLNTEYGVLQPTEIEANRSKLSAPWNPDDPIEDVFMRIRDAQRLALRVTEPITDGTAIRLTLIALEATGVLEIAIDEWRHKDEADKTMANFRLHFQTENEARLAKLTARTAGYHGAHAALNMPAVTPEAATVTIPVTYTANAATANSHFV